MFPLSSWPDFGPAVDSSDGNVFLGNLAFSSQIFFNIYALLLARLWDDSPWPHCYPCVKRFMSAITCRYLFIFPPHLSVTDNLFSSRSFQVSETLEGCLWLGSNSSCTYAPFILAGNERWGGNMSIFMCRDLRARDWSFILMEVSHRAGQAVYSCGNRGAINYWFPRQKSSMRDLFTLWLSLFSLNVLWRDQSGSDTASSPGYRFHLEECYQQ